MRRSVLLGLGLALASVFGWIVPGTPAWGFLPAAPSAEEIRRAFSREGIRLSPSDAEDIQDEVRLALDEARRHGSGHSKVGFAAVEIASRLGLDTGSGSNSVRHVVAAILRLHEAPARTPERCETCRRRHAGGCPVRPSLDWSRYYERTLNLWNDGVFTKLVAEKGFHPVRISWEDIGRYENSVWGDRISDVGIWVRRDEGDPASARLALSVRRDSNFRDKVLVVPAAAIKVHERRHGRTIEKTLPERLAELGLASRSRDRNVIVSNQFAIVPVPARSMRGAWPDGVPPRSAFNFSIYPYGSTNFVITDVIEGSHEAVVGPGQHQLLYADVEGEKAPFTASRAEDRQDLLRLESDLRSRGMDVDVQRYYLIQVPLRRDARVQASNMGTPPWNRKLFSADVAVLGGGVQGGAIPSTAMPSSPLEQKQAEAEATRQAKGLERVAIGHGETEGAYYPGSGFRGARAEEPIRVTVVYFVTPVGEITRRDMEGFAAAFASWDSQAIWGGSFVTKDGD